MEENFSFDLEETPCPVCGTYFATFRNTLLLGCPYCYTHFKELLEPYIRKYQFNMVHRGKYPLNLGIRNDGEEKEDMRDRLLRLEIDLKEEVAKENFERAAELRDEITELKKIMEEGVS